MEYFFILIFAIVFIFIIIELTRKKDPGKLSSRMHKARKEYIQLLEAKRTVNQILISGQYHGGEYDGEYGGDLAKLTFEFSLVSGKLKELGYSEEEVGDITDFFGWDDIELSKRIENMKQEKPLSA